MALYDDTDPGGSPISTLAQRGSDVQPVAPRNVPLNSPGPIAKYFADTGAVLKGGGEDISANLKAGQYGAAAGDLIRSTAALPVALANDIAVRPVANSGLLDQGKGLIRQLSGGAVFGDTQSATPTAASNPLDQRLAKGAATAPQGGTITAPATAAPGNPYFGNVTDDPGFAGRGPISARSMGAANSLDAASRAETAGTLARDQLARESADSAVAVPQAIALARDQEARMTAEQAARTPAATVAGLSKREAARLATQTANNRETNATARANNDSTNATTRSGQLISALSARERLAEEQRTGATNRAHTEQQTAAASALESAKAVYQAAVDSGDPKRIAKAEESLRARQGKYEKEKPDQFSALPIAGGVDPATGLPRGAGAIIINRGTGETKIVSPEEAKGQAAPKYESGKVYQDAKGNRAKWDGTKFVPA